MFCTRLRAGSCTHSSTADDCSIIGWPACVNESSVNLKTELPYDLKCFPVELVQIFNIRGKPAPRLVVNHYGVLGKTSNSFPVFWQWNLHNWIFKSWRVCVILWPDPVESYVLMKTYALLLFLSRYLNWDLNSTVTDCCDGKSNGFRQEPQETSPFYKSDFVFIWVQIYTQLWIPLVKSMGGLLQKLLQIKL